MCIPGYVDNLDNQFKYFVGSDCMKQFTHHLFNSYKSYTKVCVHASNGSKFDHYEFVKTLKR